MPRIFEKQHYKNNQIFDTDDLFMSHNSANDFSATLAQIQCMPVASCQTGADVVEKRATLVTDSFGLFTVKDKADETKKLIGRIVSVNFTNKNTAASMTLNIESTGAFPVTSHGIAVKAGAIGAGNYTFRLMPYGESFSWDVLDNGGLIEVKADKNVYWDNHEEYTAAQVNSALSEYGKHIYTINRTISSTAFTVDLTDKVATRKNYRISVIGNYVTSIYYDGIFSVNFDTKKFNIIKISGVNIEITSTDQYKLTIKNTFTNATDFSVSITEC